jgi:hypothetical protein
MEGLQAPQLKTLAQSSATKSVNKIADAPGHRLVLRLIEPYRLLSGSEPPATPNSEFARFVTDAEATFLATATRELRSTRPAVEIRRIYRIKNKPLSIRWAVEEWKRKHSRTSAYSK